MLGTAVLTLARSGSPDGALAILVLMGVGFTFVGGLASTSAIRALLTKVRFTLAAHQLTIEWLRRGKVVRTENVARADVIDVIVTDEPSSGDGGPTHKLAIATRAAGLIALSDMSAGFSARFYTKRRDEIARFLAPS